MRVSCSLSWAHVFRIFCLCLWTEAKKPINQTVLQNSSLVSPGRIPVNWPSNIIIIPINAVRVQAVAEIIRTTIQHGNVFSVRSPYRPAFSGFEFWSLETDEEAPEEVARLMSRLSADDVSHITGIAVPKEKNVVM